MNTAELVFKAMKTFFDVTNFSLTPSAGTRTKNAIRPEITNPREDNNG